MYTCTGCYRCDACEWYRDMQLQTDIRAYTIYTDFSGQNDPPMDDVTLSKEHTLAKLFEEL